MLKLHQMGQPIDTTKLKALLIRVNLLTDNLVSMEHRRSET
jgi:hypothetical protein